MSNLELKEKILDYIKTLYSAEYVGFMEVKKDNSIYQLLIGIPNYMIPTTISGEFDTDEEFLNFVYEELRIKNYMRVYFYEVNRTPHIREM